MVDGVFALKWAGSKLGLGRWDRRAALEEALVRRPDNGWAWWWLGLTLFRRNELTAAEPALRRALELRPRHVQARLRLAQTVERLGRTGEADALYREILGVAPENPYAAFGIGHLLTVKGDFAQAIPWFERAFAGKSDYAEALFRIGRCHAALGDAERERACYAHALRVKPDYAEAMLAIGRDLARRGDPEGARARVLSAIKAKPDFAEAMLEAGLILARSDDRAGAREWFLRALEAKPDYAEAMLALAETHVGRGEYEQVEALTRRALDVSADYAESGLAIAAAYAGRGEHREAEALARRALEAKPDYPEALLLLAKGRVLAGDREQGAELARRALDIKPDYLEAMLVLGTLLMAAGDLNGAAALLSGVTAAPKGPLQAFRYLAEVRFLQGDAGAALDTLLGGLGVAALPAPAVPEPPPLASARAPAGSSATEGAAAPTRRIAVVTSLMPRRLEIQKKAVDSWRAFGFEVLAVNTADEIRVLAADFPEIRFVQPSRTAERLCGRPLIMIDSLLEALEESGAELCGIVNSDIVIRHDPAFRRAIEREYPGSLVFGHRIDLTDAECLDAADGARGMPFVGGYDFFFFESSSIRFFKGTDLVLGMPWWDFWTPVAARLGGLAVKNLDAPMVLHLVHPVGYREEFFLGFCRVFMDSACRLAGRVPDAGGETVDLFLRRFYASLSAHRGDPALESAAATVETLCAFTNFLIGRLSEPRSVAQSGA